MLGVACRPHFLRFARLTTTTTTTTTASLTRPVLQKNFLTRTMSSSATTEQPMQEWFVIAPDMTDALARRLEVRGDHLSGIKGDQEGFWLWGGAMLEEPIKEGETPKMKGSAMLIGARTKEEVVERLKRDVYVTGGVWDWDQVQVIPFKSALRKAL